MPTPVEENLVSSNAAYVSSFNKGHLPHAPAKAYTVLTCMDARIVPAEAFGISLGDAHVIRNAGASAREGLRSIIISQQMLKTKEVLVIKHTECGMTTFKEKDAHDLVEKNCGAAAAKEVESLDFLPFVEYV